MAELEILALNPTTPQIEAAQSGDTYVVPRAIRFSDNTYLGSSGGEAAWAAGVLSHQIGYGGSIWAGTTTIAMNVASNAYYDGSGQSYIQTDYASRINLQTGSINFDVAASGTADTTISWTNALTINNSGNIGIKNSTLEAWSSSLSALQLGTYGTVASGAGGYTIVGNNWYNDGSDKYINTDEASRINLNQNGYILFDVAVSGTADTAITWKHALTIDNNENVAVGDAALATTATDGFLYIPTCAGTPTGTPTSKTGLVPFIFDSTNNKIGVYNGGWKFATVA